LKREPGRVSPAGKGKKMRFGKTLLASGVLLGSIAAATPAFASGSPVAVTATVNQTISMTGPPATLNLAGDPGTTASGNVAYTITTNDPNGYHVSVTPGGTFLQGPGSNSIPNSAMGYVPNGGSQIQFNNGGTLSVNAKLAQSAGAGDPYTDSFKLAIPGNTAAGAYTETFSYLAVAG
jgi:hypothetical protein